MLEDQKHHGLIRGLVGMAFELLNFGDVPFHVSNTPPQHRTVSWRRKANTLRIVLMRRVSSRASIKIPAGPVVVFLNEVLDHT